MDAAGESIVEAYNFRISFTSKNQFFSIAIAVHSKKKGEDFVWFDSMKNLMLEKCTFKKCT